MAEYTNLSLDKHLQIFSKAYLLFEECVRIKNPNIAEILGVIHIYRTTFEQSIRVLQSLLQNQGYIIKQPIKILLKAVELGVIGNESCWIEASDSMKIYEWDEYNEETMLKLYFQIKNKYFPLMNNLYLDNK